MFDVTAKVALVTGAAKGIGFGIAKELLENGAKGVALLDVDDQNGHAAVEELSNKFSKNSVIYIKTDVGDKKQFEDAFDKTIKTFKQLDIVVNNAGHVQEKESEKCVSVNLQGCITGSLLAIDKYFPRTLGSSQGIILNVSSIFGLFPVQYLPVYCATKYGVIGFSRSISGPRRCRNINLKVLAICPGVTNTAIVNVTTEQIHEEFLPFINDTIGKLPLQSVEQLAKHVIPIIQNGKNGSVWAINDNVSSEIEFPSLINPL